MSLSLTWSKTQKTGFLVTWLIFNSRLVPVRKKKELRHDKTNKMSVRPVKTQTSLGIRPV